MKYKYEITTDSTDNDRYLTLVRIGKSKEDINEARLGCQFTGGVAFFEIYVPNWELGYDFFGTFESYCVKYLKSYYFQPGQEDKDVEQKLLMTYIHLTQKIEKWKERKVKDEKGIRPAPTILCNICKNRINYDTCKAFPNGIPNPWNHDLLHITQYPKQKNDITFELGEAGSRGAKIQPISSIKILSSRFTADNTLNFYKKVREGLVEEEYNDDPTE